MRFFVDVLFWSVLLPALMVVLHRILGTESGDIWTRAYAYSALLLLALDRHKSNPARSLSSLAQGPASGAAGQLGEEGAK